MKIWNKNQEEGIKETEAVYLGHGDQGRLLRIAEQRLA